jgi:hypothetical protein
MILGLPTSTFITLHVLISLVGIFAGVVVLAGMLRSGTPRGWTALFLAATTLTSLSGFPIPPFGFDPARAVGVISLIALAAACFALYGERLAGRWGLVYVIGAVLALYLNVFVAIAQSFQKLPFLKALAPTQTEPPFLITQGLALVLAVALGAWAGTRASRTYGRVGRQTPTN